MRIVQEMLNSEILRCDNPTFYGHAHRHQKSTSSTLASAAEAGSDAGSRQSLAVAAADGSARY